jgi:hypothetical protein
MTVGRPVPATPAGFQGYRIQVLSPAQRATLLVSRDARGNFRDWAEIRQWTDGITADLAAACRQ